MHGEVWIESFGFLGVKGFSPKVRCGLYDGGQFSQSCYMLVDVRIVSTFELQRIQLCTTGSIPIEDSMIYYDSRFPTHIHRTTLDFPSDDAWQKPTNAVKYVGENIMSPRGKLSYEQWAVSGEQWAVTHEQWAVTYEKLIQIK